MATNYESTGRRKKKDPSKDTAGHGPRSGFEQRLHDVGRKLESLIGGDGGASRTPSNDESKKKKRY